MASKFRKLLSFKTENKGNKNIVLSNEVHVPIDCSNWSIPKEKTENYYDTVLIDFKTAFSIRT